LPFGYGSSSFEHRTVKAEIGWKEFPTGGTIWIGGVVKERILKLQLVFAEYFILYIIEYNRDDNGALWLFETNLFANSGCRHNCLASHYYGKA
jgi:hypothetical protein